MSTAMPNPVAINIGCGISGTSGWQNLDNSPTIALSRVPLIRRWVVRWPRDIRRCDVTKGLPYPDNHADYIYSSHMFEMLEREKAIAAAKECHRVLRPGGVLRLSVGDLRVRIENYLRDNSDDAARSFIDSLCMRPSIRDLLSFRRTHVFMFDMRSLLRVMTEAGFPNPQPMEFRTSRIPDINEIELLVRKDESIYAEAVK